MKRRTVVLLKERIRKADSTLATKDLLARIGRGHIGCRVVGVEKVDELGVLLLSAKLIVHGLGGELEESFSGVCVHGSLCHVEGGRE